MLPVNLLAPRRRELVIHIHELVLEGACDSSLGLLEWLFWFHFTIQVGEKQLKRVLFLVRFLQTDDQIAQNLVRVIALAQLVPELLDPLGIKNNLPKVGRPTLGHRRQLM